MRDQDGKLDLGETWQYTASHTVTQDEIDAGGLDQQHRLGHDRTGRPIRRATTASIAIVQNPHVMLVKTATVAGGTADAGEVINYAISVTNAGNMTLDESGRHRSVGQRPRRGGLRRVQYRRRRPRRQLDVGETWQYSASHTVTQAEFDAGGSISNTASVATDQGAMSSDSASVAINAQPAMTLVKSALGYHDLNNNDVADAGDVIDFSFMVNNTGNTALHNIGVADLDGAVTVTGSTILSLAAGSSNSTSWQGSYVIKALDVSNGYYDNTAVAAADEIGASAGTVHTVLAGLFELEP